jgi:hypothetical protein
MSQRNGIPNVTRIPFEMNVIEEVRNETKLIKAQLAPFPPVLNWLSFQQMEMLDENFQPNQPRKKI